MTGRVDETARWRPMLLLAAMCAAAGIYSVWRGTDSNWDLLNYHFYTAYAALHGRLGFDIVPAQLQTYFNPAINFPFYGLVNLLNDHPRIIAFIMGLPTGIYVFALAGVSLLVARRAFGPGRVAWAAAIIATAMGVTGSALVPVIGTSINDATVAALMMLALWLVLREACRATADRRTPWQPMLLAGLLAGAALGLKLTNIIYAAPLGMLILALLGFRAAVIAGTAMVVGFLVFWGPWAFLLWREFGNPTFPMYNDIFQSPDFLPIRAGDERFLPRNRMQALFYPFYWLRITSNFVSELPMRDFRVALTYVASLALVFAVFRRGLSRETLRAERVTILLVLFCAIAYVVWVRLFGIYRYLLVVESLSGILVMLALARLLPRHRRIALGTFAALAVLTIAMTVRPNWGHVRFGDQAIEIRDPFHVPPGDMLLLVGWDPMSYLIPFLPAEVRVVGVANTLLQPGQDHGLARRVREAIAEHRGGIWLMANPSQGAAVEASLQPYGLRTGECRLVRTNLDPSGRRFCGVERIEASPR